MYRNECEYGSHWYCSFYSSAHLNISCHTTLFLLIVLHNVLLGQMNQYFAKQSNAFLQSMDMSEEEFKELLKDTHTIMREDAERERIMIP